MKIHFLGHAGFCVETKKALVLMDPWLSDEGASDGAWFQFPRNQHLAEEIAEKLRSSTKAKFLYLSHEHPDHCDLPYLARLPIHDIHLLYPDFSRTRMPKLLAQYHFRERTVFKDGEHLAIPDGELVFFNEDTGLDCDSSIFVRAEGSTFLNVNDCKLVDRLPAFRKEHGPVDVFAAQYSGATWHPVCYVLEPAAYREISESKTRNKLEMVAMSIETLEPRIYLPSAGPPCFLDPRLAPINYEETNIFPRIDKAAAFLDERLAGSKCTWPQIMPGDVLDVASGTFDVKNELPYPPTPEGLRTYLDAYAEDAAPHIARYTDLAKTTDPVDVLARLVPHLQAKLDALSLRGRVEGPLFFGLDEIPNEWARVDFAAGTVTHVTGLAHPRDVAKEFYSLVAPAWQVDRAVRGTISWEFFSSTFRVRLERRPDRYQTILNAFIFLQTEDLPIFSAKLDTILQTRERIEVTAGGCIYEIDRICPHQGGDMSAGWIKNERFVVCPKHQWMFDLTKGGKCIANATTLRAVRKNPIPTIMPPPSIGDGDVIRGGREP